MQQHTVSSLAKRLATLEIIIEKIELSRKDLNLHMESASLIHADFEKRINLLERAVNDQHRENLKTHQDIASLQLIVADLKIEINKISQSMLLLNTKFDEHSTKLMEFILDESEKAALLTKRQEKQIRALLWIAASVASLILILGALVEKPALNFLYDLIKPLFGI